MLTRRRPWPRLAAAALAVTLSAAGLLGAGAVPASAQTGAQLARTADMATLRQIDVPAAWAQTKGSGVEVAVLDTGVRPAAPDLTGQVTAGPDETSGANPPGYQPPHLHGTLIGSIIAGHGSGPGDTEGIIGVAPAAKLLSVRVILDDNEPGFYVFNSNAAYDDSIAKGIDYAVAHGARVINMSLGGQSATRSLRQAVAAAIARNVVIVAAAGNDATSAKKFTPYSYPAAFSGVISVGALTPGGQRASFSDRNSSVVVSAPGVDVVGDGPGSEFLIGDGTSQASAYVAGVAALIRSKYPALTPVQVMQALVSSARPRTSARYSPDTGFGEIDAAAALRAAGTIEAGQPSAAGQPAAARFGGRPGPIAVGHRDHQLITRLTAGAAAAGAGFVVLLAVLILLLVLRRRRRPLRQPAYGAPAYAAPGYPGPVYGGPVYSGPVYPPPVFAPPGAGPPQAPPPLPGATSPGPPGPPGPAGLPLPAPSAPPQPAPPQPAISTSPLTPLPAILPPAPGCADTAGPQQDSPALPPEVPDDLPR